jgi:hypothetical protein
MYSFRKIPTFRKDMVPQCFDNKICHNAESHTTSLNMERTYRPEALALAYETTRSYNTEDHKVKF